MAGAVVVAALLLTSTSSAAQHHGSVGRLDLVSSAQPSERSPLVEDEAYDDQWTSQRRVDADTVATSSATCSGCRGVARTVEVLYVGRARHVHADNVATAWASCTDCGTQALSVQVVLVRGVSDLRADNRALAVNAACAGCDSSAAAYQLVVSTRSRPNIRTLKKELVAWAEGLAPAPGGAALRSATPQGKAGPGSLDDLQVLVTDAAPGRVVKRSVDVD